MSAVAVLNAERVKLATTRSPLWAAIAVAVLSLGLAAVQASTVYGPGPLEPQKAAMGVAVFGNWAANFLVSQTFPPLLKGLGPGPVFLGYAVLGILAGVFVKTAVRETKGRSLEEIEADLQRSAGRRFSRQPAPGRSAASR